jgi:hypothetical protein
MFAGITVQTHVSPGAYKLSTMGQVLPLIMSETGLIYTFTTTLQPLITQPEGKNLIQACPTFFDANNDDSDGEEEDVAHGVQPKAGNKRRRRGSVSTNPTNASANSRPLHSVTHHPIRIPISPHNPLHFSPSTSLAMRKRQRTMDLHPGNAAPTDPTQQHSPHAPAPGQPVTEDGFIIDTDAVESAADDVDEEEKPKSDKKAGRRKIKIKFIQDKSRHHITFKGKLVSFRYLLSTHRHVHISFQVS